MADAGARRHHAEIVERALAPAQETVALAVALHLYADVLVESALVAEAIHHHRVVDHQVHGDLRIHHARVPARGRHGAAHGRQIRDARNAGEVLHQHARRPVGDLLGGRRLFGPVRERHDIFAPNGVAILETQQVLQQDLEREGQPRHVAGPGSGGLGHAEVVVLGVRHAQSAFRLEAVAAHVRAKRVSLRSVNNKPWAAADVEQPSPRTVARNRPPVRRQRPEGVRPARERPATASSAPSPSPPGPPNDAV